MKLKKISVRNVLGVLTNKEMTMVKGGYFGGACEIHCRQGTYDGTPVYSCDDAGDPCGPGNGFNCWCSGT